MPVTHIAGALALTGWCLGPDPLVLVAGVTWAVLPDLDEVQSPFGWRVCQLLPNPVFGRGPSTDPFIPVEYRDGNCWVGHRVAIRDCGGTLGGMGQPYPVGCPIRGECHCGGRGITVLILACDWRRGEMRVSRVTSAARVV